MESTHHHPKPLLDRITQTSAMLVLALIVLAVPAQLLLVFVLGGPALLFGLTAVITALLAPFVLMLTTATPPVHVCSTGLTIRPRFWPAQVIAWSQVQAMKDYPLLPHADAETLRRFASGKSRYRPAEGKMLIVPSLPWQYRIAGVMTGEGFVPVIAFTTRTHTDYDTLIAALQSAGGGWADD